MEVIKSKVKPKLGRCKMTCDDPIDEKLTEEVSGPAVACCFSKPNFTLFVGSMGSGKSSLMISMLKGCLKRTHHNMYVIIPEISLHSISPQDNVFVKHLPEGSLYHELSPENLEEIYDRAKASAEQDEYTMLIVDDFGHLMKQAPIIKAMERLIIKMRHLKMSIFCLTQNYYQTPLKLREICTNVVLWNSNKSQNQKFFEEQFQFREDQFLRLMTHCPTIHDWALVNMKYKRIFNKEWDEIVFKDEKKG